MPPPEYLTTNPAEKLFLKNGVSYAQYEYKYLIFLNHFNQIEIPAWLVSQNTIFKKDIILIQSRSYR